ncbi:MAG: hypothetical protein JW720_11245 [Sedimentisphaerales bacterium]|nr:hypothetical protein [Sedimentisphaerales bacterium]
MSEKAKWNVLDILRILVYLAALACCAVLSITGFYPVLIKGEHLSGYPMMLHATCAPVFAACMAALCVMWAGRCCFKRGDCPVVRRLVDWLTGTKESDEQTGGTAQKLFFWVLVALSLPLILSIVLSMFPIFGTGWQEYFLAMHRYVAAAFVIVGAVHMLLLARMRVKS